MQEIVKYETIMTVFKIKNSMIKSSIQLTLTGDIHQRHTRLRSHFALPVSKINYIKNSHCHEEVKSFNHLPDDIRRETD